MYKQSFSNRNNQLIWYGESTFDSESIRTLKMHLDEVQISTGSHMSPLFAPNNPYYGQNGERRMCRNSFDDDAMALCEQGAPVWYSAWGYEEEGKIHARLTWNPYYDELEKSIHRLVR